MWTPGLDVIQGMEAEYVHTSIPPGRVFFAPNATGDKEAYLGREGAR